MTVKELQTQAAMRVFVPWFERWAPDIYDNDDAAREFAAALVAFFKVMST